MLDKILEVGKEIVMKYGTKPLVACLGMYFIFELSRLSILPPLYGFIGIILLAISFFVFKHLQEINSKK